MFFNPSAAKNDETHHSSSDEEDIDNEFASLRTAAEKIDVDPSDGKFKFD